MIQELDSKQRKIRSLRGFFLYALEIIESGKDYEILETNLQPFFWRKVKNTIRQNKKVALQEFLFGSQESIASTEIQNDLKDKIENLQNQVNFLQQKVIQLEAKFMTAQQNSKDLLSKPSQPLESSKIDQHYNYNLNTNMGSSLQENDNKFSEQQAREPRNKISESGPKDKIKAVTPLSKSQDYHLSSNQNKTLNQHNFITIPSGNVTWLRLSNLSEDDKIKIIKTGFQLQAEEKISLKKYYESKDPNSLFQLKGYSIKYESIRRTSIYKSLKE